MEFKIGVVVADLDEFLPLLDAVKAYDAEQFDYYNRKAVRFYIDGCQIVCVHCGIGKVNAATAAMYLIQNGVNTVLNYGLSGGVSGVRRGEIVLPDRFLEHDFDLTGIGYKPCEKPSQQYIYDADASLLSLAATILPNAKQGTAVSGDCTHEIKVNGTDIPNPSYVLPDGCESFVRNWFNESDEINPDNLSLDDKLGDILFNSEVQRLIKNHAGITLDSPVLKPLGKIPLKPISKIASKLGAGEIISMANGFLQTIEKDK